MPVWKTFKNNWDDISILMARIFISLVFIVFGLFYIFHFSGVKILFLSIKGFPFAAFLLTVAIVMLVGGGLSLIFGYKMKWGCVVLISFLIPITVIYETDFRSLQNGMDFLKNIGLIGGLIILANRDAGRFSIDSYIEKRKSTTKGEKTQNIEYCREELQSTSIIKENTNQS